MIRRPAALDTTSTDNSDLGSIFFYRDARISSWFSDSVTASMSFAKTYFVELSRDIALM